MKRLRTLLLAVTCAIAIAGVAVASTGPPKEEIVIAQPNIIAADQALVLTAKAPGMATLAAAVLGNLTEAQTLKEGVVAQVKSSEWERGIEPAIMAMVVAPTAASTTETLSKTTTIGTEAVLADITGCAATEATTPKAIAVGSDALTSAPLKPAAA